MRKFIFYYTLLSKALELYMAIFLHFVGTGPVPQSAVSWTADLGVVSSIPTQSHTFVEIDCETISTKVLFLPLIQEGLLSVIQQYEH